MANTDQSSPILVEIAKHKGWLIATTPEYWPEQ